MTIEKKSTTTEQEPQPRVMVRLLFGSHTVGNIESLPPLKERVRDFFSGNSTNIYVFEINPTPKSMADSFSRRFRTSNQVTDSLLGGKPTDVEKKLKLTKLKQNNYSAWAIEQTIMLDELLGEGLNFDVRLESIPDAAMSRLLFQWRHINKRAQIAVEESLWGNFEEAMELYRQFMNACPALEDERDGYIRDQLSEIIEEGYSSGKQLKIFYRIGIVHDNLFDELKSRDLPDVKVEKEYDLYPPILGVQVQVVNKLRKGEALTEEDTAHALLDSLLTFTDPYFDRSLSDGIKERRIRKNANIEQLSVEDVRGLVRRIPREGVKDVLGPLLQ